MCYIDIFTKACGCRSQALGIGRCLDALSTGRYCCSQTQTREIPDNTSCNLHPPRVYTNERSSSRPRSTSHTRTGSGNGGDFGVFSASTNSTMTYYQLHRGSGTTPWNGEDRFDEEFSAEPYNMSEHRSAGQYQRSGRPFNHYQPHSGSGRGSRIAGGIDAEFSHEPYDMSEHLSAGQYRAVRRPFNHYQPHGRHETTLPNSRRTSSSRG